MTSQAISLSAEAVKENPCSVEVLHEILCKITASQAEDGVMQRETFADGHSVRHAVTRVHRVYMAGTCNVSNMVCDMRSVSNGVQRSFREQKRDALQVVVQRVMPDVLHVVPIRDDTSSISGRGRRGAATPSICIPPWAARATPEVTRQGSLRGRHATRGATHI